MKTSVLIDGFVSELRDMDLSSAEINGEALKATLDATPVVIIPDQQIDDACQLRLAAALGRVRSGTGLPGDEERPGHPPFIGNAGNVTDEMTIRPDDEAMRAFLKGSQQWHTDLSYSRLPDRYTILSARIVPDHGGSTEFANTYSAWDALNEEDRSIGCNRSRLA